MTRHFQRRYLAGDYAALLSRAPLELFEEVSLLAPGPRSPRQSRSGHFHLPGCSRLRESSSTRVSWKVLAADPRSLCRKCARTSASPGTSDDDHLDRLLAVHQLTEHARRAPSLERLHRDVNSVLLDLVQIHPRSLSGTLSWSEQSQEFFRELTSDLLEASCARARVLSARRPPRHRRGRQASTLVVLKAEDLFDQLGPQVPWVSADLFDARTSDSGLRWFVTHSGTAESVRLFSGTGMSCWTFELDADSEAVVETLLALVSDSVKAGVWVERSLLEAARALA
jgi:hypothetical protein